MTPFRPRPLALFLVMATALCGAGRAVASETVKLAVGEATVLTAPGGIARIVVDKQGVVTVRVIDRRSVELTGVKPGETEVRLSVAGKGEGADYTVVVATPGGGSAEAVRAAIEGKPGLEGVKVQASPGGVVLSGEAPDLEAHAKLRQLAEAQAGAPVVDTVVVTGAQTVAVEVRFYAVAANTLKELGFNFSYLDGDIQGGLLAPGTLQSFSLDRGAFDMKVATPLRDAFNLLLAKPQNGALGILSAMSNVGLSQMLAQPTLLVRSGETADFLAGGDVPVPVAQGGAVAGAVSIEYRPYGVKLSVSPIVLSGNRILLKLSPEVSELDYTNQVQIQGTAVPGFRRRSTSTTVELGDGQSFVIAGLTFVSSLNGESRLPGLGDLPVIGALFKTSQTTRQRQELIVVATPHLVRPLDRDPLADVSLGTGRGGAFDEVKRLGLRR